MANEFRIPFTGNEIVEKLRKVDTSAPSIGANGNWYLGTTDTGVKAAGVSITKITESTVDGGSSIITFSDGKTLTIKNGKTPVKGTDYWTDTDKAEIKAYVDDAILNGAW